MCVCVGEYMVHRVAGQFNFERCEFNGTARALLVLQLILDNEIKGTRGSDYVRQPRRRGAFHRGGSSPASLHQDALAIGFLISDSARNILSARCSDISRSDKSGVSW